MIRTVATSLAILLATPAIADVRQGRVEEVAPPSASEELARAAQAFRNNDMAGGRAILEALIDAPGFAVLNEEEKHSAWSMLGVALAENGETTRARAFLRQATESDQATGLDWHERLAAEARDRDDPAALKSLTKIATDYPATLDQLSDLYIAELDSRSLNNHALDGSRVAMEEALVFANWSPEDPSVSADTLELNLITALMRRGEISRASIVADLLKEPMSFVRLRSSKLFDPLTASGALEPDLTTVMRTVLASRRAYVSAHPDSLAGVNALAETLLEQDRAGEALTILQAAVDRFKTSPNSSKDFSDNDKINWTLDLRSQAKIALGQIEDALSDLRQGARLPEGGVPNVSQTLNLAEWLVADGRAEEAVKVTDEVEDRYLSPYGAADREGVRACAFAALKDQRGLSIALKYLIDHRTDAPSWPIQALLCAGDIERAAKILIEQLNDPSERTDALLDLQVYRTPAGMPPRESELEKQYRSLAERPEVKAVIERYGRIETVPLVRPLF